MNKTAIDLLFVYGIMFLFFIPIRGFSQEKFVKSNSFYIELAGNGNSLASLNYERIFNLTQKKNLFLCTRLGLSTGSTSQFDDAPIGTILFESTVLWGQRWHYGEFGLGYTSYSSSSKLDSSVIPTGWKTNYWYSYVVRLGFRIQLKDHEVFRIAPLLFIDRDPPLNGKIHASFFAGISWGYNW